MHLRIIVIIALCLGTLSCGGQYPSQPTKGPAEELPGNIAVVCTATIFRDYTPSAGCTCLSIWTYNGQTICNSQCADPDNDPNGPWCYTTTACNGNTWSYCTLPAQ